MCGCCWDCCSAGVADPSPHPSGRLYSALKAVIDPNNFFLGSWAPAVAGGTTAATGHCTWKGVSCDAVIMKSHLLSCPTIVWVGLFLMHLPCKACHSWTLLDLSNCSLGGQLPESINPRFSLSHILLANNSIMGTLPGDGLNSACGWWQWTSQGTSWWGSLPEEWGCWENWDSLRLCRQ